MDEARTDMRNWVLLRRLAWGKTDVKRPKDTVNPVRSLEGLKKKEFSSGVVEEKTSLWCMVGSRMRRPWSKNAQCSSWEVI